MDSTTDDLLLWLKQINDYGKSAHNESLFSYFRGKTKQEDLTLPVISLVALSCKAVFGAASSSSSSILQAAATLLDPCACASYLYFMVAEGLLQELFPREEHEATAAQAQRFKGMVKKDNPPACSQLVSCQEFHLPLIECALQVVYYIVAPQGRSLAQHMHVSAVLQREDRAALLWQAASNFLACFGPSSAFPMPQQLQAFLKDIQAQLLQGPVFQSGSVTYEVLTLGGGCQFQPGDMTLIHKLTAAYAAQAIHQVQTVAWGMQQQLGSMATTTDSFHEQCAWLMDKVVLHHLDLCFGVDMAVLVACVVYITAKVLQISLSFDTLTQALTACLGADAGVFSGVEVSVNPMQRGTLRGFYNGRFLLAVQDHVRTYLRGYATIATAPSCTKLAVDANACNTAGGGAHYGSRPPQGASHAVEGSLADHASLIPEGRVPLAVIQSAPSSLAANDSKKPMAPGSRVAQQIRSVDVLAYKENLPVGGHVVQAASPHKWSQSINQLTTVKRHGTTPASMSPMCMR